VRRELVHLGHVGTHERDTRLLQTDDEMKIAGQAIQFRDHETRSGAAAQVTRLGE